MGVIGEYDLVSLILVERANALALLDAETFNSDFWEYYCGCDNDKHLHIPVHNSDHLAKELRNLVFILEMQHEDLDYQGKHFFKYQTIANTPEHTFDLAKTEYRILLGRHTALKFPDVPQRMLVDILFRLRYKDFATKEDG